MEVLAPSSAACVNAEWRSWCSVALPAEGALAVITEALAAASAAHEARDS